ncbi:hemolymph juvenile hormone-binding protein [Oryctes borbonicus]|uniref:Hemolymph juvenile hormone-binding protein n=1 Tax=Oryctes borbonicus TaxID=1629725 RepID=A0A0T6BA90_9SCAR|nr:hemolymph juvenile hormone-binding protein [Oryctes borbonicus]
MKMNLLAACLCVLVISCLPIIECKRELPPFLKVCHRNDPQLNQCIKSSLLDLRPHLANGIPALKVSSLHPLLITRLDISTNDVKLYYTNFTLGPMEQFEINDISADFDKCQILLDFSYPKEQVGQGQYHINGQLLLFHLDSEGWVDVNFTDVRFNAKINCKKIIKNEQEYADFQDIDMKVKIGDFHLNMTDLFKDDPELTRNTVVVFNENSKSLLEEFEGPVSAAIGQIVLQAVQRVFSSFPLDILVPP